MIPREILKQVRRIEISTKGLVNEVFSGEYHSVFKGRGMNFAEVREYQYGDDIRSITVSSRSSSKIFTKGVPLRAVTFQSKLRLELNVIRDPLGESSPCSSHEPGDRVILIRWVPSARAR